MVRTEEDPKLRLSNLLHAVISDDFASRCGIGTLAGHGYQPVQWMRLDLTAASGGKQLHPCWTMITAYLKTLLYELPLKPRDGRFPVYLNRTMRGARSILDSASAALGEIARPVLFLSQFAEIVLFKQNPPTSGWRTITSVGVVGGFC